MQPGQHNRIVAPASPFQARSTDAFYRNLPELLKKHYGKWVAYHGDECIGVGRTQSELYQECLRRGFKDDEFDVLLVTSQALSDREVIPLPPNR